MGDFSDIDKWHGCCEVVKYMMTPFRHQSFKKFVVVKILWKYFFATIKLRKPNAKHYEFYSALNYLLIIFSVYLFQVCWLLLMNCKYNTQHYNFTTPTMICSLLWLSPLKVKGLMKDSSIYQNFYESIKMLCFIGQFMCKLLSSDQKPLKFKEPMASSLLFFKFRKFLLRY